MAPGGTEAEVVDQLLAQAAFRRGVDNQRALARKADHPVLRVELRQFADVQVFDAPGPSFIPMDLTSF